MELQQNMKRAHSIVASMKPDTKQALVTIAAIAMLGIIANAGRTEAMTEHDDFQMSAMFSNSTEPVNADYGDYGQSLFGGGGQRGRPHTGKPKPRPRPAPNGCWTRIIDSTTGGTYGFCNPNNTYCCIMNTTGCPPAAHICPVFQQVR